MRADTAFLGLDPAERPSLVTALTGLHLECESMKNMLHEARLEIARLKRALASRERRGPQLDVAGLRREVAFYCHPDRGGDAELMCRLNILFDALEDTGAPQTEDAAGGGS